MSAQPTQIMPHSYPQIHDHEHASFDEAPALPRTAALIVSISALLALGIALIALGLR
jgi:hypothetical protein